MNAHTPGPWAVGALPIINGKYAGCYAIKPQAGPPLAVMIGNGPADLRAANAALIAAAPELLAACRNLVADDLTAEQLHNRIQHARAAIARAEGR